LGLPLWLGAKLQSQDGFSQARKAKPKAQKTGQKTLRQDLEKIR